MSIEPRLGPPPDGPAKKFFIGGTITGVVAFVCTYPVLAVFSLFFASGLGILGVCVYGTFKPSARKERARLKAKAMQTDTSPLLVSEQRLD